VINIHLPLYDQCRSWIKRNRETKKSDWDSIKYASRSTEQELKDFIQQQVELNDWPELQVEDWFEIVESEKEAENRSIAISEMDNATTVVDNSQDTIVTVPEDPRSSWLLYKKHLIDSDWKEESLKEIEKSTISILKRMNKNTAETGSIKGLVIGHVQSGKTANMAALMAMAADWGWNLFIVLSGTIENLRKQTQSRLFSDLNHPGNINWYSLEHLSKKSPMGSRAHELRWDDNSNMRYMTVCLKNSGRLKNLLEWMQYDPNKYKQMKIMVIDDEADQASVNTGDISKNDRKRINQLIVNLVEGKTPKGEPCGAMPQAMNYISYTATPYANFLNESSVDSLYPSNFIRTLQPSNEYFGPRQIFGIDETDDNDGLNIVRDISDSDLEQIKQLHNKETNDIPQSMKDSICWFLCAAAAMRVTGYRKPISMLVHTSQQQQHHQQVSDAISQWIRTEERSQLHLLCQKLWDTETKELTLKTFRDRYVNYGRNDSEINDYPAFDKLVTQIDILLEDITNIPLGDDGELQYNSHLHLCIDNCANNGINDEGMFVRLAYPDSRKVAAMSAAPVFIVVGGSTLSRGLTIEGLVSTYFLRSTCQADSLMQMGRWFGYRKGYELYPRIWMTEDTLNKFKFLANLEMELRQDLERFSVAGLSPTEFGPRIKNTPKVSWLRITSKNKMQSAIEIEYDFTGTSSQTISFDNDEFILKHNLEVAEAFIDGLGEGEISHWKSAYVWNGVPFSTIYDNLLQPFLFQAGARVFNDLETFAEWVTKVNVDENLKDWNVILAGLGDVTKVNADMWRLKYGSVGKINRSRKTLPSNKVINIGVLRAPKDVFADVPAEFLPEKETVNAVEIEKVRRAAGLDRTPQLIIYRINKNSEARDQSQKSDDKPVRYDLNAVEDIIGLCLIIPGNRSNGKKAKALTVKINKTVTVDEMWGDEE
jgi:Z1 domain.